MKPRLVTTATSRNRLVKVVRTRGQTLFEVGINKDEPAAWPILINVVQLDRHFFLTASQARRLAQALEAAAEAVQ